MAEKKSTTSANSSPDRSRNRNRRSFLRAVGATGATGVFGAASLDNVRAQKVRENVHEVEGMERWLQLMSVRMDGEFRQLVSSYENREPNYSEANLLKTDGPDVEDSYYTAVVPMEKTGISTAASARQQSMIVWTTHSEIPTVGQLFEHEGEAKWYNEVREVAEDGIEFFEELIDFTDVDESAAQGMAASTADDYGKPPAQKQQEELLGCPEFAWQCILGMVSSFAFLGMNCGTCVASGFSQIQTCVICVINIVGAGSALCDPCPPDDDWPFGEDDEEEIPTTPA